MIKTPPQRRRAAAGVVGFELIEPLRDLFKDEVRQLGLELGLPEEIVWRHPFPGPGLAVRCLGEVTTERARHAARGRRDLPRGAARQPAGTARPGRPSRCCCRCASVGVMGDGRTYENVDRPARACRPHDFMTADWARLPYDLLARVVEPHHQRGEGRQPRGVRHQQQAAGDDRVGVSHEAGLRPPPPPHRVQPARRSQPARRAGDRGRAPGMKAMAITDHGNMFGAIEFYDACRAAGIKPILGCEVYVAPGSRFERQAQSGLRRRTTTSPCSRPTTTGYRNLLKLVSAGLPRGLLLQAAHRQGTAARSTARG